MPRQPIRNDAPVKPGERSHTLRLGVVGTGGMARGFLSFCQHCNDFLVTRVLTNRPPGTLGDLPYGGPFTSDIYDLVQHADLVVELSGEVARTARVIEAAFAAGVPVVTLNSEFHVTLGSCFVGQGILTEAEGDQPGCLAALREDVVQMGFRPWVYGNLKGYLNPNPTPEDMFYWSRKQGISLRQTTSFTDGTKLQIEQVLVANGLGASIAVPGMIGLVTPDIESGARQLATEARRLGRPISDYLLAAGTYAGVFIVAEHEDAQRQYLEYLKLGPGPDYVLSRQFHLCHLEVVKTIRRIASGGRILLDNSRRPSFGVAAIAKRALPAGLTISRGIGSFDVRGLAVPLAELLRSVPIGLLEDVRLVRPVGSGEPIPWEAVEGIDVAAVALWREMMERTGLQSS